METSGAGWRRKRCGEAGKGLWHKKTTCAIVKLQGLHCLLGRHRLLFASPVTVVAAAGTVGKLGLQSSDALGHGLDAPEGDSSRAA